MNADSYVEERLTPQLEWYDDQARRNKRRHYLLALLTLLMAVAIPMVFTVPALADSGWDRTVAAALGGAVTIVTSLRWLLRHEQQWLHYRAVAEKLKHERSYAMTRSGPYAGEDGDLAARIAERVEPIVSGGHR